MYGKQEEKTAGKNFSGCSFSYMGVSNSLLSDIFCYTCSSDHGRAFFEKAAALGID
ncbi:hypothetical protein [Streptococcus merionis]|uniref:hypothetical protein n=1 Tax=Streptococcus merionis TaxID=400065 RepID=UPI0026F0F46B|nr:hypothetical protein [Streptococcus merionis]